MLCNSGYKGSTTFDCCLVLTDVWQVILATEQCITVALDKNVKKRSTFHSCGSKTLPHLGKSHVFSTVADDSRGSLYPRKNTFSNTQRCHCNQNQMNNSLKSFLKLPLTMRSSGTGLSPEKRQTWLSSVELSRSKYLEQTARKYLIWNFRSAETSIEFIKSDLRLTCLLLSLIR